MKFTIGTDASLRRSTDGRPPQFRLSENKRYDETIRRTLVLDYSGTLGLLSFHGRQDSNAAAAAKTVRSARWRPMICRPTGRPSSVHPAGTLAAGCPVRFAG